MDSLVLGDQFQLLRDDCASETSIQTATEDDELCEDESYYFTDVVFLVEDRLFRVPRRNFEEDSEIFRDMFHLPIPANGVPDGHSKDKPLRLEGIEKTDFKQLLRVMYPRNFGREETLTAPEWMSVLKLSSMWEFGEIRKLAIRRLSQLTIDAVEKVVIARDYHIAEWLIPSINVLAQRKKPMGVLDVNRLGWDYVLKIGEVRESFSAGANCNGYCRYCSNYDPLGGGSVSRENHNFMDVIQRVFEMDP